MDKSRFTENKTGELVQITTTDGPDWAFVPDPLPPKWEFPNRLWPLLARAKEQLARLDEKGKTINNPSLLLSPLQRREALRSSSLEGTYASPKELLLFEMNPESKDDRANEWREVANYNNSLHHGFKRSQELPLSRRLIQEMHSLLLRNVRGNQFAGKFRATQVHVGSDLRYVPPPPQYLNHQIDSFEKYLNEHGDEYDPLVLSYLTHYQFEAIHPFRDGNGRVGRALLSLTIYVWAKLHLPWLYMSPYFERYKDEYIDNLFRVSTHGDWDRWIEFCLRGTVEQCRDALRRCGELDSLRQQMQQQSQALSPRMHQLIEHLFSKPIFSVSDVAKWCSTSKPTARADIHKLMDAGLVQHLEGARPRVYYAKAIFDIAYREEQDQSDNVDEPE